MKAIARMVWRIATHGLPARNRRRIANPFGAAYPVERSTGGERPIDTGREALQPLSGLKLCAVVIDGAPFEDRQMTVAMGVGYDGRRTVLGSREGAAGNASVVNSLVAELVERGLDFSQPRLYILNGGKALAAVVKRYAGEAGFLQFCQMHKAENVIDHLPRAYRAGAKRKLRVAYGMTEYGAAVKALACLHRELADISPAAARNLAEGMEETLTVHKLRVPEPLRKTLSSTYMIESALASGGTGRNPLQFRRVAGYRQIPVLLSSMADALSTRPVEKAAVA